MFSSQTNALNIFYSTFIVYLNCGSSFGNKKGNNETKRAKKLAKVVKVLIGFAVLIDYFAMKGKL